MKNLFKNLKKNFKAVIAMFAAMLLCTSFIGCSSSPIKQKDGNYTVYDVKVDDSKIHYVEDDDDDLMCLEKEIMSSVDKEVMDLTDEQITELKKYKTGDLIEVGSSGTFGDKVLSYIDNERTKIVTIDGLGNELVIDINEDGISCDTLGMNATFEKMGVTRDEYIKEYEDKITGYVIDFRQAVKK